MAMRADNLTNSVATMRRRLLRMMDALAETGLRHAHREISRASEPAAKPKAAAGGKRKARNNDAVH